MRSTNSRLRVAAAAVFCLAALPAPALAASFTPEGTEHWVAVAHRLIVAANTDPDQMGAACQGVSLMGGGSEIRKESGQVPKWAVSAHFQTCIGFQSVSSREHGKGFMKSTNPCKNLMSAVDELGKAQPGVDPAEVVAVAGQLRSTLQTLVGDFKDAKTCKFAPGRPF
ncbi:MAG: hypothetical protein JWP15_2768 [Alphaproteobacteria bacterium]|nr:hypothetical protein [Alphaproteobacteria bacterium]